MEIETMIIIAAIGFCFLFAWYMFEGLTMQPRIEIPLDTNISEDNLRSISMIPINQTGIGSGGRICGYISGEEVCET